MRLVCISLVAALWVGATGCIVPRGPAGVFAALVGGAIVTAAIVSSIPPPPPRVLVVPAPRNGYDWQPGYWSVRNGRWVWQEGRWVEVPPGYRWQAAHWEQAPDGTWHLVPGQWVTR